MSEPAGKINLAGLRAHVYELDGEWPEFKGKPIVHLNTAQVLALIDAVEAAHEHVRTYLALDGPSQRRDKMQRLAQALARFDHEPHPMNDHELARQVLTDREHRAWWLTQMGMSQRTLATHLGLSRSTIRTMLERSRQKIHAARKDAA